MNNETIFKVSCLYFDICGATETFYTDWEYEVYGDDYVCPECYDSQEMTIFGWEDSSDSFPMSLEYDEGE